MQKWRFFESDTVSLREVWNKEDNKQSEMFEGKLKTFKNWPICTKHVIFATKSSRKQVARANCQNTQDKNFEKFIQVFFATGSSTRERVARWAAKISESSHDWTFHLRTSRQTKSRETLKTQILKNILIIFRD